MGFEMIFSCQMTENNTPGNGHPLALHTPVRARSLNRIIQLIPGPPGPCSVVDGTSFCSEGFHAAKSWIALPYDGDNVPMKERTFG